MDFRLVYLPWLVDPSGDFRILLLIDSVQSGNFATSQKLAGRRLNRSQLHSLGRAVNELAANRSDAIRATLLSNGTSTPWFLSDDLQCPDVAAAA
jgi:hypothetical protein